MLMSDSLGGSAKTLMFVNVSPTDHNIDESSNSLTYATRVRTIKNDISKNEASKDVMRLKRQVRGNKDLLLTLARSHVLVVCQLDQEMLIFTSAPAYFLIFTSSLQSLLGLESPLHVYTLICECYCCDLVGRMLLCPWSVVLFSTW